MKTEQFVFVDGGGTKTEALLVTAKGEILSSAIKSGCNPNDIGVEAAVSTVLSAVSSLSEESISLLYAGIAGAGNRKNDLREGLKKALPGTEVTVVTDADLLISAGIPNGNDGACLISGTGSVCYARKNQEITRIGGWGYLLDEAGSGYDIGRDALSCALRSHDGRAPRTALYDRLAAHFGCPPEENLSAIYAGGRRYIASLAPIVFESAEAGDPDAIRILERTVMAWKEMLTSAYHVIGHPFTAVLGGGIFQKAPQYAVDLSLSLDLPIDVMISEFPPIYGAFVSALSDRGISPTEELGKTFLQYYTAVTEERNPS